MSEHEHDATSKLRQWEEVGRGYGDWEIRDGIVRSLVNNTDKRVVTALCEALRDVHPYVRFHAVRALKTWARAGSSDAWLALLAALKQDDERDVRAAAAFTVGEFRFDDLRQVDVLVDSLWDDEWKVAYAAHLALIRLGTAAVPQLIGALERVLKLVKRGIIGESGTATPPTALERVLRLVNGAHKTTEQPLYAQPLRFPTISKEQHVMHFALDALGQIGDARALPLLRRLWLCAFLRRPWSTDRRHCGQAIRQIRAKSD